MNKTLDGINIELTGNVSAKTWSGTTDFGADCIWTDGENTYCSGGSDQYILNKATSTWEPKTWNGISDSDLEVFGGGYIWTDGDEIYFTSTYDHSYTLDKSTSTWERNAFNRMAFFFFNCIWTDGNNTYYSSGAEQYILNKSTSTWEEITWNVGQLVGSYIWSDGENIYYSYYTHHYILNKSTLTWSTKTWNGLTDFLGNYIWTDGNDIYCSNGSNQYVLDKSTSTWSVKTWSGLTSFSGYHIWSDGDNIYYSNGNNNHYVFEKLVPDHKYVNKLSASKILTKIDNKINNRYTKDAVNDIVAPEFSSSTAYAVGDYVIYEGALYKCTNAHSAGAWSSGDFTQTQVVDEVGGGSGHTIEDASGTDLTQRDTMKFGGGLNASDDSTSEKTVITDEYEKIPWSTWITYTPQQQEAHPNAIITGAPDTSSGGHIIEDASGTDLTQRETLKFEGGLNASDDSTNEQTVVTDEYEEIPYSTWSGYTSEQKAAHPNAIITGAPDGGYELPTASASTLGGVKVGNGLYISNGVLSTKAKLVTTLTGTSQSADYELVGELVVDTQSIYAINAIWSNGKPKGIGIGGSSTSAIDIFKHDYDLDKEHVLGDVILLPQGTYKIYEKLISSGSSQVISIYRISYC